METKYNIDPAQWYSPNEIVDQKLLFGKSKRYVFDLIQANKLKATDTSETTKPQWKILGSDLINFIEELTHANSNTSN